MGKSCKESALVLLECMKKSRCVQEGGDLRACMKYAEDSSKSGAGGECQELRAAYFSCKRESLDMRSRIRGPRYGGDA